jgi:hypothetical protein
MQVYEDVWFGIMMQGKMHHLLGSVSVARAEECVG